ncbi:MAG: hypothetical protein WC792_06045 [Candidatus Micrarchaeia archaeon]
MAQTYPVQYTMNQAKAALLQKGDTIVADTAAVPKKKWNYVPMFLPTDTGGHNVVHVKTRQTFLNDAIGKWKKWHLYRAGAAFFFVLSILAISYNAVLAAILALIGGTAAGAYVWEDFFISYMYRTRHLLEST